jgi:putative ABC transport system substrate-binding protein
VNKRREFILALGASVLASPLPSFAQQRGKVWRLGFIWPQSRATGQEDIDSILRGLRGMGYIEGREFNAEYRWADGNSKSLPKFAVEMVRLKVDLIVTRGTATALAVKSATREIPVIFTQVSDPVATGIVSTLARPGGNLTGWSNMQPDAIGKLIELLKAVTPRVSRLAVLADPDNPAKPLEIGLLRKGAVTLGMTLQSKEVRKATDIEAAFAQMPRERTDAVIVLVDAVTTVNRQRIVELAAKNRLPAIYQVREFVDIGGLISYGVNQSGMQERTAEYIHRIFKGAKPADLPVEQPTKFEMIINGKTAKALGLTIPQSLLISADKVIE